MTSGMTSHSRHRPKDARWSALSARAAVSMGLAGLASTPCRGPGAPTAPVRLPDLILYGVLPHTGHVVVDQVATVKPTCGLS